MNNTAEPLSEIPSIAILQALEDLEACERDPRYVVDMSCWHIPDDDQCAVCLAGSVMAKRLGANHDVDFLPRNFEKRDMLRSLDRFRCGEINDGLIDLEISIPAGLPDDVPVEEYGVDPAAFKADMRRLAAMLAEVGL
jgi:hypothetical protein